MLSIRCIFYFSQADFFAFVFQVGATVNERYVYMFFFSKIADSRNELDLLQLTWENCSQTRQFLSVDPQLKKNRIF